jgi:CHAT domain-containing protein
MYSTRYLAVLLLPLVSAKIAFAELPADPDALLKRGLHFAELYNWSDAGPLFLEAEKLFLAHGDQRNALYAHLGVIRSTMEQRNLPETSAELGQQLQTNPLLQSDPTLRLFCLAVRGDIDGEIDADPMRRDWEAALKVAKALGDTKWQNRASGEIGFAAFLAGDTQTARKMVGSAFLKAAGAHDAGAQIRYLAAIGTGDVLMHSYDDALGYFDKALKIADANPDTGYQFLVQEGRCQALKDLGRLDDAERLVTEIIGQARARNKNVKAAQALITASAISTARKDYSQAIGRLHDAISLTDQGGFERLRAEAEFDLVDIYRGMGDLGKAEEMAAAAAESTQSSGDAYLLPQRLRALAQLEVAQRKYSEADATYDRAEYFVDTMIGNVGAVEVQTGLITAMSEIYAEHFSLLADHLPDITKAYSVLERARGRVLSGLLLNGRTHDSEQDQEIDHRIGRLNLAMAKARSSIEVRQIRDQIFLAEQARWLVPGSPQGWQDHPFRTMPLARVRGMVKSDEALLEFVLAEPRSWCLVVTHGGARIVPLPARDRIEALVARYLTTLKAKRTSQEEAQTLYSALLGRIREARSNRSLIVVPDGRLHLLPFEALVDPAGKYMVDTHTITYTPSSSALYMMTAAPVLRVARGGLLGVGGVPYAGDATLANVATTRGFSSGTLGDLPGSKEEVLAVDSAFHTGANTLLIGPAATESAFKGARLDQRRIIHLAVHGFADEKHPERAALILLSDPQHGEDGLLQAGEIARLRTNAELVVLSACDTAVGRLQGEEGIANLSNAFLLAGAKSVISTLWSVDDNISLFLVKKFYGHLNSGATIAEALTAAKRDTRHAFGESAVPFYWAGYILDGFGDRSIPITRRQEKLAYATNRNRSQQNPRQH